MKRLSICCASCNAIFDVECTGGEADNLLDALSDGSGPHCGCGGDWVRAPDRAGTGLRITAAELWAMPTSPVVTEVSGAVLNKVLIGMTARDEHRRCVIDSLTMSDGTKVYLASSGLGAIVERIDHAGENSGSENGSDTTSRNNQASPPNRG